MRLPLSGRVRLVALVAVAVFALAALPAGAAPGTNGKILFGQVFPNYGVTINRHGDLRD